MNISLKNNCNISQQIFVNQDVRQRCSISLTPFNIDTDDLVRK